MTDDQMTFEATTHVSNERGYVCVYLILATLLFFEVVPMVLVHDVHSILEGGPTVGTIMDWMPETAAPVVTERACSVAAHCTARHVMTFVFVAFALWGTISGRRLAKFALHLCAWGGLLYFCFNLLALLSLFTPI